MPKIDQYSRLRHHRLTTSGQLFTIPTSNDHSDDTWLKTDLYIGEIGLNLTDDTAYFRSNNGIVQLATATSSGSSSANIWNFQSPNIVIGTTYSADSVSPRSGYYTDLGTTTLRWKDLYLGGSSGGTTQIDINGGVYMVGSAGSVLTTDGAASSNAPIEINSSSSNVNKSRPLFLNVRAGLANGSTNYITIASSQTITTDDTSYCFVAATNQLTFENGLSHQVFLGKSNQRNAWLSNTVWTGGNHALRGDFADDGTGQYEKSEWISSQEALQTSDALTYDIVNIPWTDLVNYGEVVQIKANIIATVINSADIVYSSELVGVFSVEAGGTPYTIGVPIKNEWSSFPSTQPLSDLTADGNGFYVKAQGVGSTNIQWLCSYSYHRLIKVY
jgi:hypothetical protein